MTTKQSTFQRLPMMLATGVLSTGLLLSGCSNNDSVETEVAMDETADVTSQDSVTTDQTTAISTTDNKNDAEQQTITPDDNETTTDTAAVSDVINPAADDDKQPSLVKNPTQAGTPEDTVKQALDTLYYGDVKQAASYYKVIWQISLMSLPRLNMLSSRQSKALALRILNTIAIKPVPLSQVS